MPLIACPDCSQQISDRSTTCMHCGGPVGDRPPAGNVVLITNSDANRKYLFPALLNLFFPCFFLGTLLKGYYESALSAAFLVWIVGLGINGLVAYFVPGFLWFTALVFAIVFVVLWVGSVIDAYNSHEDTLMDVLDTTEEKAAKAEKKRLAANAEQEKLAG